MKGRESEALLKKNGGKRRRFVGRWPWLVFIDGY
jgi:hypothetical protein